MAASLWLSAPLAAQDAAEIKLVTDNLSDSIAVIGRAGGNIAVYSGTGGLLLVDTGYEGLTGKVEAAVARISDQPLRFVVNTHWHFDHVGGNEILADTGALLVAHDKVRARLSSDQHLAVLERDVAAAPQAVWPHVTYNDHLTYHLGDEEIVIIHVPNAHTDGDSIVRFKTSNIIHAGDIFFNGGYPFIDINAGGSIDGMIAAAWTILGLCDDSTRIIPGHGPLASKADLEAYLEMLVSFRDIVAKEVAAGKDLATIIEQQPTAELDQKWGEAMFPSDQFTEMVVRTLAGVAHAGSGDRGGVDSSRIQR
jgi:glyoxylase-like metal-dependent hydrolase (beta-lactamase superfamily II)